HGTPTTPILLRRRRDQLLLPRGRAVSRLATFSFSANPQARGRTRRSSLRSSRPFGAPNRTRQSLPSASSFRSSRTRRREGGCRRAAAIHRWSAHHWRHSHRRPLYPSASSSFFLPQISPGRAHHRRGDHSHPARPPPRRLHRPCRSGAAHSRQRFRIFPPPYGTPLRRAPHTAQARSSILPSSRRSAPRSFSSSPRWTLLPRKFYRRLRARPP